MCQSSSKATSSVQDIGENPPFGSRFLIDDNDVWSQNAWDHVPPPDDQAETIAKSLEKQRLAPIPPDEKKKYNEKPAKHWDNFYKMNASNFFRNRKWLHNEFPELVAATSADAGPFAITEVGCGAGNSVFPLLSANQNPSLRIHAYDYSNHAVKLVQNDPLYQSPPVGSIAASVWDVTSPEGLPPNIAPETIDIVILVFVMSALHPDEWGRAINNIHRMLKPGGLVLLRDYGRYDLTQLRFKGGRLLDENFYIRGDKTRVYFFELDELALLFTGSRAPQSQNISDTTTTEVVQDGDGEQPVDALHPRTLQPQDLPDAEASPPLPTPGYPSLISGTPAIGTNSGPDLAPHISTIHPNLTFSPAACPVQPLFSIQQLGVDRRLIVNRKRQIKMYRVWMQGKFRKL